MIIPFIECGKIVNTHGVRGELKLNPWCDSPKSIAGVKKLYLNADGTEVLNVKCRAANNVVIVKAEGIDTIEKAIEYKNKVVYIKREDIDLKGRYFISEIIGSVVYDSTSNEVLGKLTDVYNLPANDVWVVTKDGKDYLVPTSPGVVVKVDIEASKVVINAPKGIFEDED